MDARAMKPIKSDLVQLELGGKDRTLNYDLNAYAEIEKRYGNIQKAMEALQEGSLQAVRTLLWAGLIHEEVVLDEITGEPLRYLISEYLVGTWVKPNEMKEIGDKLGQAINANMPDEVKEQAVLNQIKDENDIRMKTKKK